jgi:hypothetical protein
MNIFINVGMVWHSITIAVVQRRVGHDGCSLVFFSYRSFNIFCVFYWCCFSSEK